MAVIFAAQPNPDSSFSDDVDPAQRDVAAIEIKLSVEEQRRIAEAATGEPCLRFWLTPNEARCAALLQDWTVHTLSDGRFACWRRQSDITKLQVEDAATWATLMGRKLSDAIV